MSRRGWLLVPIHLLAGCLPQIFDPGCKVLSYSRYGMSGGAEPVLHDRPIRLGSDPELRDDNLNEGSRHVDQPRLVHSADERQRHYRCAAASGQPAFMIGRRRAHRRTIHDRWGAQAFSKSRAVSYHHFACSSSAVYIGTKRVAAAISVPAVRDLSEFLCSRHIMTQGVRYAEKEEIQRCVRDADRH